MEDYRPAQKRFHEHLDVCQQCRDNPFNLCEHGAPLLRDAALRPQDVIKRENDDQWMKRIRL